jgi:hypothetical protein
MSQAYTGGCACGAIRYEISAEPLMQNDCQCRDCQHKSGTGHGSYLSFPRGGVKHSGSAALWDMVGDSGTVKTRAFCPTCGSPVYMTYPARPDVFTVHAASLDDPGRYRPHWSRTPCGGMNGMSWIRRCRSSTGCRRCETRPAPGKRPWPQGAGSAQTRDRCLAVAYERADSRGAGQ